MKRLVSILTLAAFVGISALSAQTQFSAPAPSAETSALTNDEATFLFGKDAQNLNVQVLSQKQLEETKGEFWGAIVAAAGLIYGIGRDQKWW